MRVLLATCVLCVACGDAPATGADAAVSDVPSLDVSAHDVPVAQDAGEVVETGDDGLETPASLQARLETLTSADAERYAHRIVPVLLRRSVRESELEQLAIGGAALPALLAAWSEETGVEDAARDMISTLLAASGARDGTDLDLPGNLAAQLVRDDVPWTQLVTADYCVDGEGAQIECDTGAPYAAGILTTRAFMAGNESRYNLRRARTLVRRFVCVDYPIDAELQPRIQRELLTPMIQATSAALRPLRRDGALPRRRDGAPAP